MFLINAIYENILKYFINKTIYIYASSISVSTYIHT